MCFYKTWRFLIVAALFCGSFLLMGFRVCPKCGFENEDDRKACVHCEAQLQDTAGPAEKTVPVASNSLLIVDGLNEDIIAEDVRLGVEQLDKGNTDLARLFLKNASGLNMLIESQDESSMSAKIVELLGKCAQAGRKVERKCLKCDGTGAGVVKSTMLNNEVKYRSVPDKLCSDCGGSGKVMMPAVVNDQKYIIGQAMKQYAVLRQAMGFVRVGEAWIPAGLDGKLTGRQTAVLKQATAMPCSACMGVGREDCGECNGTGSVKCGNKGCVNGMVEEKISNRLSKTSNATRKVKCAFCGGSSLVMCVDCNGIGSKVCRKCNGTGERAVCTKCGGKGVTSCTHCGGAGTYKGGLCVKCRGEGDAVCSSCMGDGRKR